MDNRVFNVNGSGLDCLAQTLTLAFEQEGRNTKAEGYVFEPEKGLILLWYLRDTNREDKPKPEKFLVPLNSSQAALLVFEWLKGEQAKKVKLSDWDENVDHDGSNSRGWRVYCERWGHVGSWDNSIVAITPAFMWHGK